MEHGLPNRYRTNPLQQRSNCDRFFSTVWDLFENHRRSPCFSRYHIQVGLENKDRSIFELWKCRFLNDHVSYGIRFVFKSVSLSDFDHIVPNFHFFFGRTGDWGYPIKMTPQELRFQTLHDLFRHDASPYSLTHLNTFLGYRLDSSFVDITVDGVADPPRILWADTGSIIDVCSIKR